MHMPAHRPLRKARRSTPLRLASVLLLALALGLAACETGVDTIREADRYFSLYGYLDMQRDTQFVRVEAITGTLQLTSPEPLEARVTTTDLMTGDTTVWRDSVVAFRNGTYGHVFWAPLRVVAEHTYRFEVERPDGALTWAETTIPPRPRPEVLPPRTFVQGTLTRATQQVVWHDVPRAPDSVEVWYRFIVAPGRDFVDLMVPPEDVALEGATLELDLNLNRSADSLHKWLGTPRIMAGLSSTITVQDAAWRFPNDVFDYGVLSQPGAFSNVTGGFGFLGSLGSFSVEWVLEPRIIEIMGFYPVDTQDREGVSIGQPIAVRAEPPDGSVSAGRWAGR